MIDNTNDTRWDESEDKQMDNFYGDNGTFSEDELNQFYEVTESNSGYIRPSYMRNKLEDMYKKINLIRESSSHLKATPDDWLDTGLWIKSLKETT
jgi:hypothetical protein